MDRRRVTLATPRMSVLHVLRRVGVRLLDIQVWDVAGTMTFYLLLSLLPAAVALVSSVSTLGLAEETIGTLGGLAAEIFPSLDTDPWERALLALSSTQGGTVGLILGLLGALISASNGVAVLHRAMHRVYDTREGRPFLWFRTIVFAETVVLLALVVLTTATLGVGSEVSQRIGAVVGISQVAFETWNLVKWPLLLAVLILVVSLAYFRFPNVRLPRYRLMTLGSILAVLVLFGSAMAIGWLTEHVARLTAVLTTLNGVIALLLLVWLACIVLVAGAALDAEFLRARQLALGLPAWDHIQLPPRHRHSLHGMARDADRTEELSRTVVEAARDGAPVTRRRDPWVVDASNPLAVRPSRRAVQEQGEQHVAEKPDPAVDAEALGPARRRPVWRRLR